MSGRKKSEQQISSAKGFELFGITPVRVGDPNFTDSSSNSSSSSSSSSNSSSSSDSDSI